MNPNEKSKDTGETARPRARIIRRTLIGLAWLVTVVVLFYAEEDWRGRHAWNHYRQQMESQGVPLPVKREALFDIPICSYSVSPAFGV